MKESFKDHPKVPPGKGIFTVHNKETKVKSKICLQSFVNTPE